MKRYSRLLLIALAILPRAADLAAQPSEPEPDTHLVLLRQPSLAERAPSWARTGTKTAAELLAGDEARRYRETLLEGQQQLIEAVRIQPRARRGDPARLEVLDRQTDLLNLLVVRADASTLEALRTRPEVAGVYPNAVRYPLIDAAPGLVGAPALWALTGGVQQAGEGMRIAILDSGINVDHPMFQGDGLSAPSGFPQPAEFEQLTNDKVIVARNYALPRYGLRPEQDEAPRDRAGHGSRVAAAAAGNRVQSPVGMAGGIAPRAYLGNYRVFGDPSINPTTTSAAVIAALTDALNDGMHVVNLSLGGPAVRPSTDPEQRAIANAVALGVVVAVAAGNSGGQGAGSITSPGTSPHVITVGATSHVRRLLNALRVAAEGGEVPAELETIQFLPGSGMPLGSRLGPLPLVSVTSQDFSGEACDPLQPGSLGGRIALVRRGTCLFATKATNVLTIANASAMVLYNNVTGAPVRADFGSNPPSRPAGMITLEEGEGLLALLEGGLSLEAVLEPLFAVPGVPDVVAGFSGRGPNIDGSIKPDVAAPGVEIFSAGPNGSSYVISSNGTSFSTPLVAGAAALLRQLHPDWTAEEIKSVLVNSATTATVDGETPATVHQAGAGRLDLTAAVQATVSVDPVSLSFGNLSLVQGVLPPQTLAITNIGTDTVEMQFTSTGTREGLRLQTPETLTLAAGERVEIEVCPAMSSSLAPGSFEGALRILVAGRPALRVPFWGVLLPARGGEVLQVSQLPMAQFSTLGEALAAAQPGDTVEVVDSGVYPAPLELSRNLDGAALHGVTLRAASGQTPILRAPPGATAVVTVNGLENVTVSGFRIQGGQRGIVFTDGSGVVRDNVFESDLLEAIQAVGSAVHLYGNTIEAGPGRGIGLFEGSRALIQFNQVGGPAGGRGEFGIFAAPGSVVSLFDNRVEQTSGPDNGQGIRLSDTVALLEGNLVSGSRGGRADGIAVLGDSSRAVLSDNLVFGNQRNGVAFFDGAQGTLLRLESRDNGSSGLLVQDSGVEARSSSFLENSIGVQGLFAPALTLEDSLLAGSRLDGLSISQVPEDRARVSNSTLARNNGRGISWDRGRLELFNSILWDHPEGDLEGPEGAEISFSLLDDDTYAGRDGNYRAEPRFAAPDSLDFTLLPDSEAVDRGPVLEGDAVSGDLRSRQRVVDGDGDGVAVIDTGALELASPGTPPLLLPFAAGNVGEFLGLALANVHHPPGWPGGTAQGQAEPAVTVRHYDGSGRLQAETTLDVEPGTQRAVLLEDLLPQSSSGWVELTGRQPDLLGFALLGADDLAYLDGSQLEPATSSRCLLPEIATEGDSRTLVYVVNPHLAAQTLEIRWVPAGGAATTVQRMLPGRGLLSFEVRELFGGAGDGYLVVEGERPIGCLEIFGNDRRRAGLAGLRATRGVTRLLGAQLASTDRIETHLNLVNLGPEALVSATALDEAGVLLDQVTFPLAAAEQLDLPVRGLFPDLPAGGVVGWLEVRSLSSDLAGSVRFGDDQGTFLAALPLQEEGAREFLLSHVAQTPRIFTGLTLLNPNPENALASIEVFSSDGRRQGLAFLTLAPGQKLARLLAELLPEIREQAGGFVRIRSTHPLAGFELFGDLQLTYLSAVPQQTVTR